ncbi:MAG TPA: type II toxin-antitoxin system PemK/MazF family toxin [Tepidiformaceae bacterium]|nr:type II toxin-antitoxin system PemK/MazF family toxin [Tepidiformaceae bacterium]
MTISQGEIFWYDAGEPIGSLPAFRRPWLVVQSDALNRSRLGTVLCVPLTSNLVRASAHGNVLIPAAESGLPTDSVAVVVQITPIRKEQLETLAGRVTPGTVARVIAGLNLVLAPVR